MTCTNCATESTQQQVASAVGANKASTDAVKSAVDASKASTDSVKSAVDASKASTDSVKSAVDASKVSTDAVKSAVDANKASTDASKASIDAVKSAVDANKASTDAVKSAVDANKASTDGLKESIDGLGAKLDGIKGSIDENGKTLKDVKDVLSNDKTGDPSDGSENADEDKSGDCPYNDIRCNESDPWADYVPDPLDPPKSSEEIYQSFKDELGNGGLGLVLNYEATEDSNGSCPTFTIPGSRYWPAKVVDSHCQVYDTASPIIYRIMTWAWAFVGLWILIY